MPFEHGLDGSWEPETYLLPLPFNPCCEDCLFEAWERMTYGGVQIDAFAHAYISRNWPFDLMADSWCIRRDKE